MSDVYVYHFMRRGPAGKNILSKRRATIETINGKGEAVMESQIVVDQTEVDSIATVTLLAAAATSRTQRMSYGVK